MKTAISGKWHCWESNNNILLSDEETKRLKQFPTIDDCINWLYIVAEDKPAARSINAQMKA